MNCPNCNTALDGRARFCAKCGSPVVIAPASNEPPTLPLSQPQAAPPAQPAYYYPGQAPPAQELNALASAGNMPLRPRKRRGGCFVRGLLTLIILALLLGAGWVFGLRPYLHAMAQDKIDQAFSQAVQQMPPQLSQVPAGPIPFSEDIFNNLIQLTLPPNSMVKQVVAHITASEIRVDFQVYGLPCDVTGVPQVVNQQLEMTNVHVDGIIGLIMSNDEMAATLNRHLASAQARLNRPVQAVQLEDQKMILTLGPASATPPPLP